MAEKDEPKLKAQKKLRKVFTVPSEDVLDTLKFRAIKKHIPFEEFYYFLMREGYKTQYGKFPEEED